MANDLREILHGKYLRILWDNKDIQLFDEELTEYFEDQRENGYPELGREFIRKAEKAKEEMMKYHYELVHMMDIEKYQIEEIDKLKEMIADSKEKVTEKLEIRRNLEAIVADLRSQLKDSQNENAGRKELLEKRDNQLQQAQEGSREKNATYKKLLEEALESKNDVCKNIMAEIDDIGSDNSRMQKAVQNADRTTKELKQALDKTSQVLKESSED